METHRFIIRYGCNDFVFEGSILELAEVVRALEELTPVLFSTTSENYKETGLQKRLRIFSARIEKEAGTNNPIYVIDK